MIDDPLAPNVEDDERISRFIFLPGQFNVGKKRVRPGVFKPRDPIPPQQERQYSVYRTKSCAEKEVWTLSDNFVAKTADSLAIARADLEAKQITDEELRLVPYPNPHPRHANIVNWPDTEELRELKAVALATKANLIVRS
jgi:hypothetical protein